MLPYKLSSIVSKQFLVKLYEILSKSFCNFSFDSVLDGMEEVETAKISFCFYDIGSL
jgi:hypothetical protein